MTIHQGLASLDGVIFSLVYLELNNCQYNELGPQCPVTGYIHETVSPTCMVAEAKCWCQTVACVYRYVIKDDLPVY